MAAQEGVGLGRGARRDPKIVGDADVADEDAAVEQRLPGRVRVREPAEEDEVGVAGHRLQPERGQLGDDPVALRLDRLDRRQQLAGVRQRRPRHGLGGRGQVVGQPDQAQGVDERRLGGEVAQPAAGERERLAHGPRHDQPRRARRSRVRALGVPGPGELGVGLVDDDHARRRGLVDGLDDVEPQGRAGRVVGRAEEDHVRAGARDLRGGRVRVEVEGRPAGSRAARRPTWCRPALMMGCME